MLNQIDPCGSSGGDKSEKRDVFVQITQLFSIALADSHVFELGIEKKIDNHIPNLSIEKMKQKD